MLITAALVPESSIERANSSCYLVNALAASVNKTILFRREPLAIQQTNFDIAFICKQCHHWSHG